MTKIFYFPKTTCFLRGHLVLESYKGFIGSKHLVRVECLRCGKKFLLNKHPGEKKLPTIKY